MGFRSTKTLPSVRRAGAAALACLVVACGGDDAVVQLPEKVGARVVYIADTDGTADWWYGDEIWVADTQSTTMAVTRISSGTDGEYIDTPLASPGGRYLGAHVGDFCPGGFQLLDADSGHRFELFGAPHCAPEILFSPDGNKVAVRYQLSGGSAWKLALGTVPGFQSMLFDLGPLSVLNSLYIGSSRFSADSGTFAWIDDAGLYSSFADPVSASPYPRSVDNQWFEITPNGALAIRVAPGSQRIVATNLVPTAPPDTVDLTTSVTGADVVGGVQLSPDGQHFLYGARIGGLWQIWLGSANAPLTEQRVDGAATASPNFPVFAWNTDGTRFAWLGKIGANTQQLYVADVATPTAAVQLSVAAEGLPQSILWSDPTTVVYLNYLPQGGAVTELRSVAVTAPLATVALSPPAMPYRGVVDVQLCADGYVAFLVIDDTNSWFEAPPDATRIYSARPMVAGSYTQITPTHLPGPDFDISGITGFACE